jgi:hypothetical protein
MLLLAPVTPRRKAIKVVFLLKTIPMHSQNTSNVKMVSSWLGILLPVRFQKSCFGSFSGTVCQGVDGYRVVGVTSGGSGACTDGQQRCKEPGATEWNMYEECVAGSWTTRPLAAGTACQALPRFKVIGVMPGTM